MNEHTVLTMDIVAIFPSVKFRMIQKAQNYFVRNTSESDKQQVKLALEIVRFGMTNTFIQFKDQYWLYGGNRPVNEKGLITIGGFESAGFADLVAAYILEQTEELFQNFLYTMESPETMELTFWRDNGQQSK